MKTPLNTAGQITENIMSKVKAKLPNIKTHEYNYIYSSVLNELLNYDIKMETSPAEQIIKDAGLKYL